MNTTIAKRQNDLPSVSFGNVVDNIFQNSLRHFLDDNFWDMEGRLTTGSVPVNVRETDNQYEMDVIAPGCKKEDFNVNINDNMLTISFESIFPILSRMRITGKGLLILNPSRSPIRIFRLLSWI